MSRSIDERVVSMRFDNKQFEAAAATSMGTLDKLKSKLDFRGASKGLEELSRSADKVSLSGLVQSAEAVEVRFSAMSVAAITSIQRIVNRAIDAGAQITKSLTIDPVSTGFNEYELKMGSVQTIMASTGESLTTVMGYLNELNTYADRTIYSFADMTTNIGKFTNAGVKLEDAVKAIQGISNEAAVSGANANEASRAMYNFAQALSAGYVKLIDWKSIELANMATVDFKNQLLETAAAFGTISKASDGTYRTLEKGTVLSATKNFNESLEQQWLTTDVLITTLGKYADETTEIGKKAFAAAQDVKTFTQLLDTLKEAAGSGWAETWEIVIGNFEEAKELWTTASNVVGEIIGNAAEERNNLLRDWKALGGRDSMLRTFGNAWTALLSVITPVRDAIRDVFPPMTGERLYALTKSVENFTKALRLSEEALYTLKVALKAFMIPLNIAYQLIRVGSSAFLTLALATWRLVDSFLAFPSKAKSFEKALRKLFGDERYERAAKALDTIIDGIGDTIVDLASRAYWAFQKLRSGGVKTFSDQFERLGKILSPVTELLLDGFVFGLEQISKFKISNLVSLGKNGIQFVTDRLRDLRDIASPVIDLVRNLVNSFSLKVPSDGIASISQSFAAVKQSVADFDIGIGFEKAVELLKDGFESVKDSTGSFIDVLEEVASKIDPVKLMIFAFGITVTGVALSSARAVSALAGTFDAVTGTLNGFTGVLSAIQKRLVPSKFQQIATAIAILAGALVVMATVDAAKVQQATISLLALMGALTLMVAAFAAIDRFLAKSDDFSTRLTKMSTGMGIMSAAILALTESVAILSTLDIAGFAAGLAGVLVLMTSISAATIVISKFAPVMSKNSLFLLAFAVSIATVVRSLEKLANANLDGIQENMVNIRTIMVILMGVAAISSRIKFGAAAGIGVLAINLLLFVKVLRVLGQVDAGSVAAGLGPLIPLMGLIAVLGVVTRRASSEAGKIGKDVLLMSASIILLIQAIKQLQAIDPSDALKGTVVVSALLGVFALLSRAMGTISKDQKKASLGKDILLMSGAIFALSLAIKYIGAMDTKVVVKGTAAIAALMGMFGIVASLGKSAKGSIGYLVTVTFAIGILTTAMTLMTLLPAEDLVKSVTALTVMLTSFGVAMRLASGLKMGASITNIVQIGLFVAGLSYVVTVLSGMDVSTATGTALSVSALLIAVSAATHLIQGVAWASSVKAMGLMGLMLAGAVAALLVLNQIDLNGIAPKIAALTSIIAGVAGASLMLSFVNPLGASVGLAAFAKLMGFVTAVVTGLGLLSQIPGFDMVISDGSAIFSKLGQAIGSFVGNVVGGLVAGAISGAVLTSASTLSDFSETVKPFLDNVASISSESVTGALNLAKIVLAMSGAGVVDGILSLFGIQGDLSGLGEDLSEFAAPMAEFIETISAVGADKVSAAAAIMGSLSDLLDAIPETGGILSMFTGKKDLSGFATGLENLGTGLKKYWDTISGISINPDVANGAVSLAESVSGILNALPSSGGVIQDWFGGKSFELLVGTGIGNKTPLERLAEALVGYNNIVSAADFGSAGTTKSVQLAESVSSLVNSLPSTGGKLQEWFGGKDLSKFAANLTALGAAVASYYGSLSAANYNSAAGENATQMLSDLSTILNSLPETGVFSGISGEKSLSKFGDELVELGDSLIAFQEKVASVDADLYSTAVQIVDSLSDGVGIQHRMFEDEARGLLDGFLNVFRNRLGEFKTIGGDIVQGIIDGVNAKKSALTSAMDSMCQSAISTAKTAFDINSPSKEFYAIGEFIIEGLINGIQDNAPALNSGMIKMGVGAIDAVKEVLGIHSPSTVARDQVGRYIVKGIAEGITSDMSAEEAAARKAENIVSAFRDALDSLSIQMTTADLENQLWNNLFGETSSDTTQKDLELVEKKLQLQAERVAYANAEYQATVKTLGANADATREAYNKFLQEKITLSELAQTFYDLNESITQNQQDSMREFYKVLNEDYEALQLLGYTEEQMREYATKKTGYDPNKPMTDTKKEFSSAKEVFDSYLRDVEVVIQASVSSGTAKASSGGKKIGTSLASGISSGVSSSASSVTNSVDKIIQDVSDKVSNIDFSGSATNVAEGLIDSLNDKITQAGDAGANFFEEIRNGFNSAADINSPSKKMYESGVYVVQGLANGINDYAYLVQDAIRNTLTFVNGSNMTDFASGATGILLGDMANGSELLSSELNATLTSVIQTAMIGQDNLYYQNGVTLSTSLVEGIRDGFKTTYDAVFDEMQAMLDRLESDVESRVNSIRAVVGSLSMVVSTGGAPTKTVSAPGYTPNLSAETSTALASKVAATMQKDRTNPNSPATTTNNFAFTQNNYSPKALSQLEIYRQTKNQFAMTKEMVTTK